MLDAEDPHSAAPALAAESWSLALVFALAVIGPFVAGIALAALVALAG